MASDFVQTMVNADIDAVSLSGFMSEPSSVLVPRRLAEPVNTLDYFLDYLRGIEDVYTQKTGVVDVNGVKVKAITQAVIDALNSAAIDNNTQVDTLITATPKDIGMVARTQAQKNYEILSLEDYIKESDGVYLDNALDALKADRLSKGFTCGINLKLPPATSRVKRSHDLSVLGLRLVGTGGRYASRIIADADGDYSAGYVLKLAPTAGSIISNGSGLIDVTIDLNEAPAIGLHYIGAYDTSVMERSEIINGHKDFPVAVIEPHPNGSVIQTLKIDTCAFNKKQTGGTGHTVVIRKAQECLLINTKFFGSPYSANNGGSIPLLLEDCRGVQLIGGGYANSTSHCIDIYANTRNAAHITIIGATFENYPAKAIRTRANEGLEVQKLTVFEPRAVSPFGGLLDGSAMKFCTVYANQLDVLLNADCEGVTVHAYDPSKVTDLGRYNIVIGSPSTVTSDYQTFSKSIAVVKDTTPAYDLRVTGKTGKYSLQWRGSATADYGCAITNPAGVDMIKVFDDRLAFYGGSTVTQRTSPTIGSTDTVKIGKIIQNLEELGLFKPAT